jgi:hypothetical protein
MQTAKDKRQLPLRLPASKPRNPLGLVRKGTIRHKNKRKELPRNFDEI